MDLGAEVLGAVVAQQVVDPGRVDQPAQGEAGQLGHAQLDQPGQRPGVLAQVQQAGGLGPGDGRLVQPGRAGPRRPRLPCAGVHAGVVLVGVGGQVHPVDPQRHPRRPGLALQHHRPGAVRQHPAQELGVVARLLAGLVAARLEVAAGQLGADRDGDRVLAEADRRGRRLERGHPRAAHPAGRQRLQGPASQAPVDHGREPGDQHVPLGRPGGQHADVGQRDPALAQRGQDRPGRQLLVEHGGVAVLVQGVVPAGDAVGGQHPPPEPARPPVDAPEQPLGILPEHRLPGQKRPAPGDEHRLTLLDHRRLQQRATVTLARSHAGDRRHIGPPPQSARWTSPSRVGTSGKHGRPLVLSAAQWQRCNP